MDRQSFPIVVRDTTPPAIASITPTIGAVAGRLFPVTLTDSVSDLVDTAPTCKIGSVTASEPGKHTVTVR
ncbi:MAG TPA: hypothetical protein VFA27_11530 [Vicinamibacterales bacterium]|nr:hypothetical protein [Vicinamibacterales bacterium]